MSKVTSLKAKHATTVAQHIHLTTDLEQHVRHALSNDYAEYDESAQTIVIGCYGYVHLSNNPESDFDSLMNNLVSEYSWSSFNGIVIYDLETKSLDIDFFLDDYWLCGDASDSDPSEQEFIELNPSLYENELKAHAKLELESNGLYDLIKNSQFVLQHSL